MSEHLKHLFEILEQAEENCGSALRGEIILWNKYDKEMVVNFGWSPEGLLWELEEAIRLLQTAETIKIFLRELHCG